MEFNYNLKYLKFNLKNIKLKLKKIGFEFIEIQSENDETQLETPLGNYDKNISACAYQPCLYLSITDGRDIQGGP